MPLSFSFSYQGDEGDKNAAQAIENPHQFVMKPQLEGGGTLKIMSLLGKKISENFMEYLLSFPIFLIWLIRKL